MQARPIVYIITSLSVGGAQKALLNLLKSDLSQHYPPIVVSLVEAVGIQDQFQQLGIPIYIMRLNQPLNAIRRLIGLWQFIRFYNPAIIHGWMHHGNLMATLVWFLRGCRQPLLWSMHHTPEAATLKRWHHAFVVYLGRWLSACPVQTLYVSQRSLQRHQQLGYSSENAQVLINGVPDTLSLESEQRIQVRQELGIALDAIVIGSLTRFVPEKDIPNLFDAIALIQQQNSDTHFILAGEGLTLNQPQLKLLLEALPQPKQVHLLGVQSNAVRLMATFDIATLSSQREALPLFLVEAMSLGIPCVATDVGDIAKLIDKTGLIVPSADPQALANAWLNLIKQSKAQRQQLGQQAKQRVKQYYSLKYVVNAYKQLLQQVLAV